MCYYVYMKKEFKIYTNGKLNITNEIKNEVKFRATLVGGMFKEIGNAIIDDLASVR